MSGGDSGPVKIELGAKASIEVKAEVPKEAAGRFVDAITDIVRPWSEARGLKADLIRLQREDVAFRIATRAARTIAIKNLAVYPVPLKVLIPLLEKGSQESPDDDFMIDRWAALLASSTQQSDVAPRFVSLLSEINGRQARKLLDLYEAGGGRSITSIYSPLRFIAAAFGVGPHLRQRPLLGLFGTENVGGTFLKYGLHLVYLGSYPLGSTGYDERVFDGVTDTRLDAVVLQSLGLVDTHELRDDDNGIETRLEYYGLTDLGAQLIRLTRPQSAADGESSISPDVGKTI